MSLRNGSFIWEMHRYRPQYSFNQQRRELSGEAPELAVPALQVRELPARDRHGHDLLDQETDGRQGAGHDGHPKVHYHRRGHPHPGRIWDHAGICIFKVSAV